MQNSKYLQQFTNAYHTFMKESKHLDQELYDINGMQNILECWKDRDTLGMKYDVDKYKEEANHFFNIFKKEKGLDWIINRCNDVSRFFLEYLSGIEHKSKIYDKPLFITIGNVKLDQKYLFEIDTTNLSEKISNGTKYTTPIDFHVWVTLPDLSIIDMTLDGSLKYYCGNFDVESYKIIMWREDKESILEYEPLYIHTDIRLLID